MRSVRLLFLLVLASLLFSPCRQAAAQAVGEMVAKPFLEPMALSRGTLKPIGPGSSYFSPSDRCRILKSWGWTSCAGIDAMITAHPVGVATLLVEKPNSGGHVSFAGWDTSDKKGEIDEIWNGFVAGLRRQADETGSMITPSGWAVEPMLDKTRHLLFYALAMQWDGHIVINAKMAIFDRRGYVVMRIVPTDEAISEAGLKTLVHLVSAAYQPGPGQAYDDFRDGDPVAATGATGVLAELVDVTLGPSPFDLFVDRLKATAWPFWIIALVILGGGVYLAFSKQR